MDIEANSPDKVPDNLSYHRKCYQRFTLKRDIDKLKSQHEKIQAQVDPEEIVDDGEEPRRKSNRVCSDSPIEKKICLFCKVNWSKRFADGGLKDALIQSSVIAEGSVDSALRGKSYNRGVRMYKLFYEALQRLLIDQLVESGKCGRVDEACNELVLDKIDKQIYDTIDADTCIEEYFNNYIDLKDQINKPQNSACRNFGLATLKWRPSSIRLLVCHCCQSRGELNGEVVAEKMLSAKGIGKELMVTFNKQRLEEGRTLSIFDRMKKQKLPTFSNIPLSKAAKHKARLVAIESTKELFAKIAIIAQTRVVDLEQLLSFPLIELPLSLSEPDGTLKKTAKSKLLHTVEGDTVPVEMLQKDHAFIVDASRLDVVFDVYFDTSIKDIERQRRSTGEMIVKKIVSTAPIKQWGQLLSSGEFNNKLVTFFLNDWKTKRHLLDNKTMYVNDSTETWKFTKHQMAICNRLHSNQEEADTRMLLHANDASSNYQNIIISTPDTDVFILAASNLHAIIGCNIFILTGSGYHKRLIDLNLVCETYFTRIEDSKFNKEMVLQALPGFHCFTGCDSISAFSGRGKIKPLKVMIQKSEYVKAFAELGTTWDISEENVSILEAFVCHMYGKKDSLELGISIDDLRYNIYCRKNGKVSSESLPPCQNVLRQHIKRANYQARIWRMCLDPWIDRCDPSDHGWGVDDGGLFVNWMTCNPALTEVLTLVTCDCKVQCDVTCPCKFNEMECCDACGCDDCGNRDDEENDQDDEEFESDEESDIEDN
ncbi:uncharacterized protein [Clytia hemisphaerica]|uniref:uncharacterized protein n=1 Tax=Clytia hemisphaerica TaxID=252671 RepID=UPI0034D582D0